MFEPVDPSTARVSYNGSMSFGRRPRNEVWVRVAAVLTLVLFLIFLVLRRGRLW